MKFRKGVTESLVTTWNRYCINNGGWHGWDLREWLLFAKKRKADLNIAWKIGENDFSYGEKLHREFQKTNKVR